MDKHGMIFSRKVASFHKTLKLVLFLHFIFFLSSWKLDFVFESKLLTIQIRLKSAVGAFALNFTYMMKANKFATLNTRYRLLAYFQTYDALVFLIRYFPVQGLTIFHFHFDIDIDFKFAKLRMNFHDGISIIFM